MLIYIGSKIYLQKEKKDRHFSQTVDSVIQFVRWHVFSNLSGKATKNH